VRNAQVFHQAQTLNGISVQTIFFQPDVNINLAVKIVLFGFTGVYPAFHDHEGDDFEFEQHAYRNWELLSR
jgi:hypothetical protein